ncbi:uncharacterized protein [Solanum lycopersicum]|uniref:uncharacterized protein n=1 Tax=Solanum lycopersicum TaxID=4081 RepID=UPI003749EE81
MDSEITKSLEESFIVDYYIERVDQTTFSLQNRFERIEAYENIFNFLFSVPNTHIAYSIMLTVPVTVASIERSFLKLKLIKSTLRSIMSQERSNKIAILSFVKE